jgi:hypothetical protein
MGGGRAGVTGPQPGHLVCYRDEAGSGGNTDDDISREYRCDRTDRDPDAGQDGDQRKPAATLTRTAPMFYHLGGLTIQGLR